jgi:hypothetical protein
LKWVAIFRFAHNLDVYKRVEYKETHMRVEFIDPFFEALGWDVRNVRGYAEQYKDVVHEDAIKVRGMPHAPDYCFRIGGVRKFFLEAKRPSVSKGISRFSCPFVVFVFQNPRRQGALSAADLA